MIQKRLLIHFFLLAFLPATIEAEALYTFPAFKQGATLSCNTSIKGGSSDEVLIDTGVNCMQPIHSLSPIIRNHNLETGAQYEISRMMFTTVERRTSKLFYKSLSAFFVGISYCRELLIICDHSDLKSKCLLQSPGTKDRFCFARKRAKESFLAVDFSTLNFSTHSLPEQEQVEELIGEYDFCLSHSLNLKWDPHCYDETVMSIEQLREKATAKVDERVDELFTSIESPYYALMANKISMVQAFEGTISEETARLTEKRAEVNSDYISYKSTYDSLKSVLEGVFGSYIGMLEQVAAIHSKVKDLANLLIDPELMIKLEERKESLVLLKKKVREEKEDLMSIGGLDVDPAELKLGFLKQGYQFCALYYCEALKPIRPSQPRNTWIKKSCFIMKNHHGINNPICKGQFEDLQSGELHSISTYCADIKNQLSILNIEPIDQTPRCRKYDMWL